MKLHKKTSNKPLVIVLGIIVVAIVAGFLLYFTLFEGHENTRNPRTTQQSDGSQQNTHDEKSDHESKDAKKTNDESVPHEKEKELPQLYEGENTNTSAGLTGAINSKSVSGDYLVIRSTINQFIDSGTCELTLRSGSKTVSRSVEIIQNPSSSSCAGFDIPVSELSSGQWNIEIKVSSGNRQMTLTEVTNI